jgi:hypothetical protein
VVDGDFIFIVGELRLSLTRDEVDGVYSRAVEPSLPARALHSELKTAIREGGGEIVVGDNNIRQEIFDYLDAVEAERGSLTDRESALREALREPFHPQS